MIWNQWSRVSLLVESRLSAGGRDYWQQRLALGFGVEISLEICYIIALLA
eukprot:COSAG05_NODE_19227_length_296_cov_0.477157_1_plen_49_part_10